MEESMGRITEFLFKSVEIGGKRKGSYNVSSGVIKHPPIGTKGPKVKSKTKTTKGGKG